MANNQALPALAEAFRTTIQAISPEDLMANIHAILADKEVMEKLYDVVVANRQGENLQNRIRWGLLAAENRKRDLELAGDVMDTDGDNGSEEQREEDQSVGTIPSPKGANLDVSEEGATVTVKGQNKKRVLDDSQSLSRKFLRRGTGSAIKSNWRREKSPVGSGSGEGSSAMQMPTPVSNREQRHGPFRRDSSEVIDASTPASKSQSGLDTDQIGPERMLAEMREKDDVKHNSPRHRGESNLSDNSNNPVDWTVRNQMLRNLPRVKEEVDEDEDRPITRIPRKTAKIPIEKRSLLDEIEDSKNTEREKAPTKPKVQAKPRVPAPSNTSVSTEEEEEELEEEQEGEFRPIIYGLLDIRGAVESLNAQSNIRLGRNPAPAQLFEYSLHIRDALDEWDAVKLYHEFIKLTRDLTNRQNAPNQSGGRGAAKDIAYAMIMGKQKTFTGKVMKRWAQYEVYVEIGMLRSNMQAISAEYTKYIREEALLSGEDPDNMGVVELNKRRNRWKRFRNDGSRLAAFVEVLGLGILVLFPQQFDKSMPFGKWGIIESEAWAHIISTKYDGEVFVSFGRILKNWVTQLVSTGNIPALAPFRDEMQKVLTQYTSSQGNTSWSSTMMTNSGDMEYYLSAMPCPTGIQLVPMEGLSVPDDFDLGGNTAKLILVGQDARSGWFIYALSRKTFPAEYGCAEGHHIRIFSLRDYDDNWWAGIMARYAEVTNKFFMGKKRKTFEKMNHMYGGRQGENVDYNQSGIVMARVIEALLGGRKVHYGQRDLDPPDWEAEAEDVEKWVAWGKAKDSQ